MESVPVLGVTSSGKTVFIAAFGWWISYKDFGVVTPTKGTKYLTEIQTKLMRGKKIDATPHGPSVMIEMVISKDYSGSLLHHRRFQLFDISGEEYRTCSDNLIDTIKKATKVIIIVDLDNKQVEYEQQVNCFANLIRTIKIEHKKKLKKIPFIFLFPKFDKDHQPYSKVKSDMEFEMATALQPIKKHYSIIRCSSILYKDGKKIHPFGYDRIFNALLRL